MSLGLLLTCEFFLCHYFTHDLTLFCQGVALFWSLTGIGLSRRNHVPILSPDDRYFRSAFGQASLVVLVFISAFQLVSLARYVLSSFVQC